MYSRETVTHESRNLKQARLKSQYVDLLRSKLRSLLPHRTIVIIAYSSVVVNEFENFLINFSVLKIIFLIALVYFTQHFARVTDSDNV